MGTLDGLRPEKVFGFFEEISQIPRGSHNERAVGDYLMAFAKARGLEAQRDNALNVLIRKPGFPGYEEQPGIILQAHMDMVCEKNAGSVFDFTRDGIQLRIQQGRIYGTGTTLGADDGIGLACILGVLADAALPHPPLEALFTTNEEDGMTGAASLDPAWLTGRRLINLDAEDEGVFYGGCAGSLLTETRAPISFIPNQDPALEVQVLGLAGGHSGVEIDKGHPNACKLLGRLLLALRKEFRISLVSLGGGGKNNAIPPRAEAVFTLSQNHLDRANELIAQLAADIQEESKTTEPELEITVAPVKAANKINALASDHCLHYLALVPDGVQSMSPDLEGLVESSLNLGILETKEGEVVFNSYIRSSINSRKWEIAHRLEGLADMLGMSFYTFADQPPWPFDPRSPLIKEAQSLYTSLFKKQPLVTAVHDGLECAYFKEKFPEMDMVSIGPAIKGAHTPNENLEVASVLPVYDLLKALLAGSPAGAKGQAGYEVHYYRQSRKGRTLLKKVQGPASYEDGYLLTYPDLERDLGMRWLNLYRPRGTKKSSSVLPIMENRKKNIVKVIYTQ